MCYFFFLEYIWIFFLFCPLFVFIEKKVPSPQREMRSRVFGRGERDKEKRADECREEEEGRGLEYLSLFSRSRSFSLPRCDASLSRSVMRKIPPACLVSGR